MLQSAWSQRFCGTTTDASTLQALQKFYGATAGQRQFTPGEQRYSIPLKIHVVRRSDGTDGLDTSLLTTIIDTLNHYYRNAMLSFDICGGVEMIDDDRFVNYEATEDEDALTLHNVPRMINLYFADTVLTNGHEVCGYAYMAGGPMEAFISNACAIEGNTVVHEIGHIFALIHTHGSSNSTLTKELVDGSNCASAGDFICDTPADPNLSDKTTYYSLQDSCAYTGSVVDANGDAFSPMLDNIMAYTPAQCKPDTLTPLQYQRVYNALFYYGLINMLCSDESAITDGFISAYPNPFGDEITLYYEVKNRSLVSLAMYDILGNDVRELFFDYVEPGRNKLYISYSGQGLSHGIYCIKLTVDGKTSDAIKVMAFGE